MPLVPLSASAQEGAIVVHAASPVPVSVEAVAAELRHELPQVPVLLASGNPRAGGSSVTLSLSAQGHLLVVYGDAGGRETARIVADTHDPSAVAAAVAMIVANLHRDQLPGTLAAIGAPAPPGDGAEVIVPAPAPAPAPAAARVAEAAPLRTRAVVTARREGRVGLSWSPTVDVMPNEGPALGLATSIDLRLDTWRVELHLGYAPAASRTGEDYLDETVGYVSYRFDVTRFSGLAAVRRLILDDATVRVGVGGGLGFVLHSFDLDVEDMRVRGYSPTPYEDSYVDLLLVASTALDVHLTGPAWWSSRVDAVASTNSAASGWFRDHVDRVWLTIATGARVVL